MFLSVPTISPTVASPRTQSTIRGMRFAPEREARALIEKIDAMGGARAAIESGFMQQEIGESAYRAQRALEEKSAVVVGVNDFVDEGSPQLPILTIDESVERDQVARLRAFREGRAGGWQAALEALDEAARTGTNLMPRIVDCVRGEATVGEIVGTLKNTFGEHRDQGF